MIDRKYKVGDVVRFGDKICTITAYVDYINVCSVQFENGKIAFFTDDELSPLDRKRK